MSVHQQRPFRPRPSEVERSSAFAPQTIRARDDALMTRGEVVHLLDELRFELLNRLAEDRGRAEQRRLEVRREGPREPQLETAEGETCPECARPLARRRGRFGPFVGCTGYPDCRYIKKTHQKTDVVCPECAEGELVQRRGRGRSVFFGCTAYPACSYTTSKLPGKDDGPPLRIRGVVP